MSAAQAIVERRGRSDDPSTITGADFDAPDKIGRRPYIPTVIARASREYELRPVALEGFETFDGKVVVERNEQTV
jgi:hypothetical protein